MRKLSNVLVLMLLVCACNTETIRFNDLTIIRKDKEAIIADGFDNAKFTLIFNEDANISLINATAEIINGRFADSETNELTVQPIKDPDGVIRADIIVTSTTIDDSLKVTFNINEFRTTEVLSSITSVPAIINLQASAFSVANSFDSEIQVNGIVLNSLGKKASNGYQIIINDTYEDGTAVNGLIRETLLTTANGQVSFIYSPGPINPNQFINLEAIVLDENGSQIGVTNQIQIFITNNNE